MHKEPRYIVRLPDGEYLKAVARSPDTQRATVGATTEKKICAKRYKTWTEAKAICIQLGVDGVKAEILPIGVSRTRQYLQEQNKKSLEKRKEQGWGYLRVQVPDDLKEMLRRLVNSKLVKMERTWEHDKLLAPTALEGV